MGAFAFYFLQAKTTTTSNVMKIKLFFSHFYVVVDSVVFVLNWNGIKSAYIELRRRKWYIYGCKYEKPFLRCFAQWTMEIHQRKRKQKKWNKKTCKNKNERKKIHSNYLSLICILCYMFCCYCSTIYREWRYGPLDVDWLEIIKLLIETTNYETATSISQHVFSFGWSFWVLESKKYYMKMLWPSHIENSKWNSEITR